MNGLHAEDLMASILEMAPNGIFEMDAEGTILYSNPAHHRLMGYPPGDLIGRNILELLPPLDAARLHEDLEYLRTHKPPPTPYTNRAVTRDGRELVVEVHWTYKTDPHGAVTGFVSILNDVTDRMEADRLREEARRAAEASARSRSRFLAAASHDLRQPLQALSLFVSRLGRRTMDDTGREILADMRESVATLSTLMNALLDMSKFDSGMAAPRVEAVALGELFAGLARDFAPPAERAGLRLRVRPTNLVVRTDGLLLRRILGNLIANAITYTSQGGVLLTARRRGKRVQVQVWDTGIGIPEEQQDLIFQEFYQAGDPMRERSEGLGLGLAIVDRACRILGHAVEVGSRPGRGSVFTVLLPLASAGGLPAAPLIPPAAVVGAGEWCALPSLPPLDAVVAMAEDDGHVRRAMASLLREWGCHVVEAPDGPKLLLTLATEGVRPDVVVTDLRLPGELDGLATVAALRAELDRAVPALVVTGDTDPQATRDVLAAGHAILHKPVDVTELHACLTRLLQGTR